jgi:hypothetical protein
MNGTEIQIVLSTQMNAHADNQKTDMAQWLPWYAPHSDQVAIFKELMVCP